jgi:hypothetical protein
VIMVPAIVPKVRGFKPGRRRRILRAIKIRSTTSFGGEVKSPPHIVRLHGMLKMPAEYNRDTSLANLTDISRQVSPCFTTRYLCWYLPESSGG